MAERHRPALRVLVLLGLAGCLLAASDPAHSISLGFERWVLGRKAARTRVELRKILFPNPMDPACFKRSLERMAQSGAKAVFVMAPERLWRHPGILSVLTNERFVVIHPHNRKGDGPVTFAALSTSADGAVDVFNEGSHALPSGAPGQVLRLAGCAPSRLLEAGWRIRVSAMAPLPDLWIQSFQPADLLGADVIVLAQDDAMAPRTTAYGRVQTPPEVLITQVRGVLERRYHWVLPGAVDVLVALVVFVGLAVTRLRPSSVVLVGAAFGMLTGVVGWLTPLWLPLGGLLAGVTAAAWHQAGILAAHNVARLSRLRAPSSPSRKVATTRSVETVGGKAEVAFIGTAAIRSEGRLAGRTS